MIKGGSTSQGLRPDKVTKVLSAGAKVVAIAVFFVALTIELLIYNAFYLIFTPAGEAALNPVIILGRMLSNNPVLTVAAILSAALIAFISSRLLRKESREDPRGFKLAKEQTQGSNHLMRLSEMEREFNLTNYYEPSGIIVGVSKDLDKLITVPFEGPKSTATRNMLVCGTSGSRKTSGVLIGNIYSLIKNRSSIVVTDPKGEIYTETIAAATAFGYNVKIFNIIGQQFEYSDGWDVLKVVRESDDPQVDADVIVNVMIKNIGVFEDSFWNDANTNLLKLAILTVAIGNNYIPKGSTNNAAGGRTMDEVYRLISSSDMERDIKSLLTDDKNRKYLKAPFDAWSSNSQKEQIRSGLAIKFSILQTEKLTRILSEDEIDFRDFNEKPTILYLMCSDRESTYRSVLALFVNTLFKKMSDIADKEPLKKLRIPLYVILEEAKNIGYIPDLSVFIATIRSRNIAVWMCYQNLTQMMDTYSVMRGGRLEWVTIRDNCNIQLCCGADGGSKETLEHFSNKSGMMTIEEITSTKNVSSYVPKAMKFNARESERKESVGRAVLLPSEIKDIRRDEILIYKENCNPAIETKYYYVDHPLYDFRIKAEDGHAKDPGIDPQTHFTHIPLWRQKDMAMQKLKETGRIAGVPKEELVAVRVKDIHKQRRLKEIAEPESRKEPLSSRIWSGPESRKANEPVKSMYSAIVESANRQAEGDFYEACEPMQYEAASLVADAITEKLSGYAECETMVSEPIEPHIDEQNVNQKKFIPTDDYEELYGDELI